MTEKEYDQAETVLILKYGSVEKAINHWLETEVEDEEFDMLDFFLSQPAKHRRGK